MTMKNRDKWISIAFLTFILIIPAVTIVRGFLPQEDAIIYLKAMFGIGAKGFMDKAVFAYIAQNWVYYVFALIGCAPIVPWVDKKLENNKVWQAVYAIGLVAAMVISVSFISNNAYNPFIYFNF